MLKIFKHLKPRSGALDILKYIGPGFLVTVGFIDPGNWASNVAAGSRYGYALLWMVTLSTIMLIILQHNAAHLGIATGLCLSEASTKYFKKWVSRTVLATAVLASIATALAEILGAAIGLNMLFGIPLGIGATLTAAFVIFMLISNSYKRLERWIIGFVSLIGLCFLYELSLCDVEWALTAKSLVIPSIPLGSMAIVMSVLGAVVMPHNIFLHSEIIQSRHWNTEEEKVINRQLKYEFTDTLLAMIAGWAINGAMIIVAAAVFYSHGISVTELPQAQETLRPLLGNAASNIFAFALICAGISSSVTAGLAGGSIFAGIFSEPFNIKDPHSRTGVVITLIGALGIIFLIRNPFEGLIWSQVALSVQLPFTIFSLIFLTSSKKIMGGHANSVLDKILIASIGVVVTFLNLMLLKNVIFGE